MDESLKTNFLLYGANGYTGQLIARHARQYGLTPVLAGRNREAIEALAKSLGLPHLVFDLSDRKALNDALRSVKVVLNAAGPFSRTAVPMVEACLETGTHYLDVTGEVAVFERLKSYDGKAAKAGIMVMPGTGFDVVPTDCVALHLKQLLPDATHLKLAFAGLGGGVSHGTAITVATTLGERGAIRSGGKLVEVPVGDMAMWVDFGEKRRFVMRIPWGDISTAHHTTGIPNIETYMGVSPKMYRVMRMQFLYNWLLRTSLVRNMVIRRIKRAPAGPTDEQRSKASSLVWGQVANAAGKTATVRLTGPDGYTMTYLASLAITRKVLEGSYKAGYQTPAGAYGADFVCELPGVKKWADK